MAKQKISMQDFLKNLAEEGNSIESVKKEIRGADDARCGYYDGKLNPK